jgi:hypothetical protein
VPDSIKEAVNCIEAWFKVENLGTSASPRYDLTDTTDSTRGIKFGSATQANNNPAFTVQASEC